MNFPETIRTGLLDSQDPCTKWLLDNHQELFCDFIEQAIQIGCKYVNESNRETLTETDIKYAFVYLTYEYTPNINNEDEEDEDESDYESADEDIDENEDEEFTRGNTDFCKKVNDYYDNFESWSPETPMQKLLYPVTSKFYKA